MADESNRDTANKRLKNAYLAMPVAGLEVEKGNIFSSLLKGHALEAGDLDTQYLAIRLIDFLAEKLAVGQGASREEIIARIAEHVKTMCPHADSTLCSAVASRVLDRLANGPDGYKAFSYAFYDEENSKVREYSFRLIEYWQPNLAEAHVYRATPEAVTLFLSMFTIDPILEHAAQNFLIKHLLETGHVSGAVEVARRASSISTATQAELQSHILDLKRNPRKRGWVDNIIDRLEKARVHILTRYAEESALLETISEMMKAEQDDGQQISALIKLKGIVEKCYEDHLHLGTHIAEAVQAFHMYHAHAFFTPKVTVRISPEEQIIPRIMDMPLGKALQMAEDIGCFFLGPQEPKVLDLFELFSMVEDALFRETAETRKGEPEVSDVDAGVLNDFDEEREGRLRDLVASYVLTQNISSASAVLHRMDRDDAGFEKEDYVAVLHVLRSVFRRESELRIDAAPGGILKHRFAAGTDLAVTPAGKEE
ncbi:MAG: hypothetical protein LBC14_08050 [Desulfovibrio sp.]|jgi:hypothetical protein|nr:hypothetical protein [Desulfovibrio sp.]